MRQEQDRPGPAGIPLSLPCPQPKSREQPSSSASPPVLPTGQQHSQQVEGQEYAQAKEHPTNVSLSYREGEQGECGENTAALPTPPLDAQGPLRSTSSSEGDAQPV